MTAMGTLEGHGGPGQYCGEEMMCGLGVGGGVAVRSAGRALRVGVSLYLRARHADATRVCAFYCVCMYAKCLAPYVFLGSPYAGPCDSPLSTMPIPSCLSALPPGPAHSSHSWPLSLSSLTASHSARRAWP